MTNTNTIYTIVTQKVMNYHLAIN